MSINIVQCNFFVFCFVIKMNNIFVFFIVTIYWCASLKHIKLFIYYHENNVCLQTRLYLQLQVNTEYSFNTFQKINGEFPSRCLSFQNFKLNENVLNFFSIIQNIIHLHAYMFNKKFVSETHIISSIKPIFNRDTPASN